MPNPTTNLEILLPASEGDAGKVALYNEGFQIVDAAIGAMGGAGTGDVVGPASSVDSEIALFSGTTGKLLKRITGNGLLKVTSGVVSGVTEPAGSLVGTTATQTLTAKRITKRVQSVADAATVTPNADSDDCVDITALAQAVTIAAPSGTPTNFQTLMIRLKDNGSARGITWNSAFVAGGVALPSTTVLSKIVTLGFIYNTANSLNKWQCVASAQEA